MPSLRHLPPLQVLHSRVLPCARARAHTHPRVGMGGSGVAGSLKEKHHCSDSTLGFASRASTHVNVQVSKPGFILLPRVRYRSKVSSLEGRKRVQRQEVSQASLAFYAPAPAEQAPVYSLEDYFSCILAGRPCAGHLAKCFIGIPPGSATAQFAALPPPRGHCGEVQALSLRPPQLSRGIDT